MAAANVAAATDADTTDADTAIPDADASDDDNDDEDDDTDDDDDDDGVLQNAVVPRDADADESCSCMKPLGDDEYRCCCWCWWCRRCRGSVVVVVKAGDVVTVKASRGDGNRIVMMSVVVVAKAMKR